MIAGPNDLSLSVPNTLSGKKKKKLFILSEYSSSLGNVFQGSSYYHDIVENGRLYSLIYSWCKSFTYDHKILIFWWSKCTHSVQDNHCFWERGRGKIGLSGAQEASGLVSGLGLFIYCLCYLLQLYLLFLLSDIQNSSLFNWFRRNKTYHDL